MYLRQRPLLLAVFSLLIALPLYSQSDVKTDSSNNLLFRTSLDDLLANKALLNTEEKSSVASQIELPIRTTPAIISVFTQEDIEHSGARDLMELLTFLPGFNFENDVNNSIGIGVRGMWGMEGKVLLIVDGHPLNETSFGSVSFNQHFFLDNISRIEIIRGPGSALYGGMAALAVIKITTKDSFEFSGINFSQSFGYSQGHKSRQVVQSAIGKIFSNGVGVSVSGYTNQSNFSNQLQQLANGSHLNYFDSSAINSSQINMKASYKGLQLSYLYDHYTTDLISVDGGSKWEGHYASIKHRLPVSSKIEILPQLNLNIHQPWNYYGVPGDGGDILNTINSRFSAGVKGMYSPNEKINIVTGADLYHDRMRLINNAGLVLPGGDRNRSFHNIAAYAQGIYSGKWTTITAGLRVENHNRFGESLVPRLGVTQRWRDFHFKFLLSGAFKSPTFINLITNINIKPERFKVVEAEIGYTPSEEISLSANIYRMMISYPIIYVPIDDYTGIYENIGKTGTQGLEFSTVIRQKWGNIKANYSYYIPKKNEIDYYAIEGVTNSLLGFPKHKITWISFFNLNGKFDANMTLIFQSKKVGFVPDAQDNLIFKKFDPTVHLNAQLSASRFLMNNLTFSAGVYNLLNTQSWFVQPYQSGEFEVPQMGREFILKLSYKFHGE